MSKVSKSFLTRVCNRASREVANKVVAKVSKMNPAELMLLTIVGAGVAYLSKNGVEAESPINNKDIENPNIIDASFEEIS